MIFLFSWVSNKPAVASTAYRKRITPTPAALNCNVRLASWKTVPATAANYAN